MKWRAKPLFNFLLIASVIILFIISREKLAVSDLSDITLFSVIKIKDLAPKVDIEINKSNQRYPLTIRKGKSAMFVSKTS